MTNTHAKIVKEKITCWKLLLQDPLARASNIIKTRLYASTSSSWERKKTTTTKTFPDYLTTLPDALITKFLSPLFAC